MTVPVHRREFDAFLSYGHKDHELVNRLYRWLTKSGLHVYLDDSEIAAGADFADALQRGIERSRSLLVVATADSVEKGWVKRETNIGIDEMTRSSDFRVIPLKLADAPDDKLPRGISWITLSGTTLTRGIGAAILQAFYPGDKRPDPRNSRDVYVSASWRPAEQASSRAVCKFLCNQGFRLVGDSKDQKGFGEDRIERIIRSCGGFVSVLPFRDGVHQATASASPYKYFLREIDLATELGLPSVIIADPRVERTDAPDIGWHRMEMTDDEVPASADDALSALWEEWRQPQSPHYVFMAVDLDSDAASPLSPERRLVERVTGMKTVVGNEIVHDPVQHGIVESITGAHLVIADLSGEDPTSFNLNTSIEAGMALSSGTNLRLMAQGSARRPPFMLRSLQMPVYDDELDRLALLHDIARSFRRRVINAEM